MAQVRRTRSRDTISEHNRRIEAYERIEMSGQMILVPAPDPVPPRRLFGHEDAVEKALAAWWRHADGTRLNIRLVGRPGVGKNTIIYHLARELKMDLYIVQGHENITAEDVCCTARMASNSIIEYVASPLMAAMLRGGICFFDEIGKMRSEALAPLASVLDERRTLKSVLAGITVKASEQFRVCAATNEEDSDFALPPFVDERLPPAIRVATPPLSVIREILADRFDSEAQLWADTLADLIEESDHLSPREALTAVALAEGLRRQRNTPLTKAAARVTLEEALDVTRRKREQ